MIGKRLLFLLHRSKDINCIAMLQSQKIKGDIIHKRDSHEWKSKNKYVIEHDKKGKDGNCDIFSLHANHLCVKFYTYNIWHSIKSILPLLFINVVLPLKCLWKEGGEEASKWHGTIAAATTKDSSISLRKKYFLRFIILSTLFQRLEN